MMENYNSGRSLGEYSVNTSSTYEDYKTQSSRGYTSNQESEDSGVIKVETVRLLD